jgi:hypothetical protein
MGMPIIWAPHVLHTKDTKGGKIPDQDEKCRIQDTSRHLWVDGGITCNYPIKIFDSLEQTLGFALKSSQEINSLFQTTPEPSTSCTSNNNSCARKIDTLLNYCVSIIKGLTGGNHFIIHTDQEIRNRTVYIDHSGVGTLEFDLTLEQKDTLLLNGWDAMCRWWQKDELIGKCPITIAQD